MTSSNGNDWFPKAPESSGKTRRIDANIPEHLYSQLEEEAAAAFRTIPGQLCFVLNQHFLNKGASLISGYTSGVSVRAGEGGSNGCLSTTDNLPLQHFDHQQHSASKAVSPLLNSLKPKECLGKESEETPLTKSKSWKKEFPPCLEEFEKEILEFWKAKGGKKSERSWSRLMSQLSKIHAHLNVGRSATGKEKFLDQLDLAIAKGFESISYDNFLKFAVGNGKAPEPEPKHPASQVFRASDMNWPSVGDTL